MKKILPPIAVAPLRIATALAFAVALAAIHAAAREISSDDAGRAAAAWVRRDRMPMGTGFSSSEVAEVRTANGEGGAPVFHVVRMVGGGVVVTSAESGVTPVVAFLDGDVQESAGNPLWEILNADMSNRLARVKAVRGAGGGVGANGARQRASVGAAANPFAAEEAEWAELLGESTTPRARATAAGISDASGLSDLRVPELLTTKWDQENGAGNYYTPPNAAGSADNFPCGCVALAGAQIAYFWQYPVDARPQVDRSCYVQGEPRTCRTMGGTYDWSNMPSLDFYSSQLSVAQRQAVGKLCYDFGVAALMNWGPGGSGTVSLALVGAFTDVFGYTNAMSYIHFGGNAMPDYLIERTVLANLDAGRPVTVDLAGHTVVADGYGYSSGSLYTHLNFGWSGLANAWYNLPDVDDSAGTGYVSTVLNGVIYNIFPAETGELLTGRVLDENGDPVSGATVTATNGSATVTGTTNGRGIYALRVTGGMSWTVAATAGAYAGSLTAEVGVSSPAVFTRTVQGASVSNPGTIGNSWGNDITLGVDASEDQPSDGYAAWAAQNGLGAAGAVTDGQPNLVRYLFGRPSGAFSPFTGITFQDGDPVIWFQSFNPDVSDVSLSILTTTNLLDWTHADEFLISGPPFNFEGVILSHPDTAPARFYKLKVE